MKYIIQEPDLVVSTSLLLYIQNVLDKSQRILFLAKKEWMFKKCNNLLPDGA